MLAFVCDILSGETVVRNTTHQILKKNIYFDFRIFWEVFSISYFCLVSGNFLNLIISTIYIFLKQSKYFILRYMSIRNYFNRNNQVDKEYRPYYQTLYTIHKEQKYNSGLHQTQAVLNTETKLNTEITDLCCSVVCVTLYLLCILFRYINLVLFGVNFSDRPENGSRSR